MSAPMFISKLPVAVPSGSVDGFDDFIRTVRSTCTDLKKSTSQRVGHVRICIQVIGKVIVCAEQMTVHQPPLQESTGVDLNGMCEEEQRAHQQINERATLSSIAGGKKLAEAIETEGLSAQAYLDALPLIDDPAVARHVVGTAMRDAYNIEIAGKPVKLGGFCHVSRELSGGSRRVAFLVTLPPREKNGLHHYVCSLDKSDESNPADFPPFISLDIDRDSVETRALSLARIFCIRIVATVSFSVATSSGKSTFLLEAIENRDELFECLRKFEQDLTASPARIQGDQLSL